MPILLNRHNNLLLGAAAKVLAVTRKFFAFWVSATRNGGDSSGQGVARPLLNSSPAIASTSATMRRRRFGSLIFMKALMSASPSTDARKSDK